MISRNLRIPTISVLNHLTFSTAIVNEKRKMQLPRIDLFFLCSFIKPLSCLPLSFCTSPYSLTTVHFVATWFSDGISVLIALLRKFARCMCRLLAHSQCIERTVRHFRRRELWRVGGWKDDFSWLCPPCSTLRSSTIRGIKGRIFFVASWSWSPRLTSKRISNATWSRGLNATFIIQKRISKKFRNREIMHSNSRNYMVWKRNVQNTARRISIFLKTAFHCIHVFP